ncbi:hypothetical protein Vafri_6974, partial [Volvox africanus]
ARPQSTAKPSTPNTAGTTSCAGKSTAKYYCSHHGANDTHDSKDCCMLHGSRSAASTSAVVEQPQRRPAPQDRGQRPPGYGAGGRARETLSCEYCGCAGHTEEQCYVAHPDKAPPNFRPLPQNCTADVRDESGRAAEAAVTAAASLSDTAATAQPMRCCRGSCS